MILTKEISSFSHSGGQTDLDEKINEFLKKLDSVETEDSNFCVYKLIDIKYTTDGMWHNALIIYEQESFW